MEALVKKHFVRGIIAAVIFKRCLPTLLPYGPAKATSIADFPSYSDVDESIINLTLKSGNLKKIFERVREGEDPLLLGPETVVFSDDLNMYTFSREGRILKLENFTETADDSGTIYADVVEIARSVGAPLGGQFAPGSKMLYFADALLGLCRIDLSKEEPKIESVVTKVQTADGKWSPILFADDVDIGKSGMVYFSDATDIVPQQNFDLTYDALYTFKLDFLRNNAKGRILRYNPHTGDVDVLVDGINFSNGVAVEEGESSLIFCETSRFRLLRYHLAGPKQGEVEIAVDKLFGFVDGAACSHTSGKCYAAIPSTVTTTVKLVFNLPDTLEKLSRNLMMMLPKVILPKADNYAGFVELANEGSGSKINRIIQDPDGRDLNMITGVTENGGKLYLGSLSNDFIGVYDLLSS